MNPAEMIVLIVAIVMIASVLKQRRGGRSARHDEEAEAEAARLRQEVGELKERLKVLERITVDKESSLSRQIDELRDR